MTLLPLIPQYQIQKIAIIDDDKREVEMAELELEAAGFEPFIVNGPFPNIETLTNIISREAQAALCDHRLAHQGYANFSGASLVAHLYDLRIPAILITQYADIDNGITIRSFRDKIPILLSRDEADASNIAYGIECCLRELRGDMPNARKPHRTLIRVVEIRKEAGEKIIDAIVPSWNPYRAVQFPAKLLPHPIRKRVKEGTRLFAQVNIGAEKPSELYFKDFELAEEPDTDDELS